MWWDEPNEGVFQMMTVEAAFQLIQKHLPVWQSGMDEIRADRDYPPFNRVMMDGIALRFSDYEKGLRTFKVNGICPAGEPSKKLIDGCMEVMTGAPLPDGADLVIQYEHLKIENGTATIVVETDRKHFESIHAEGSDCRQHEVVLPQGHAWNGPHVGIAASMGESSVSRHPQIMIISTGDELVEDNPLPHQIRRSNAYALQASLGFPVALDHLSDDPKAVSDHYHEHAEHYDLLIYSGGVSKGKFDYLPNVWADVGVTKIFHEVSQRPGKPLWFGMDEKRKTAVVGLPGNPVSSLVCLHRYLIPGREMYAKLSKEIEFKKPLTYFMPVKIEFTKEGQVLAHPLNIKNSGEFTALAGSDGFIELPKDQDKFSAGETFRFFSWRSF